jgi:hypothetical protein
MPKKLKKEDLSGNSAFRIPDSDFNNPVLFVGAGPGDPELITVKGQRALMAADVVIYAGSLVPERLLPIRRANGWFDCTPGIRVCMVPFLNRWLNSNSKGSLIMSYRA